ncbi:hypothetical protein GLAREA_03403 [Glarea lozoyensis ATCC 20868]|uniref:Uncharacterized protein n=1 Tax=Glarea lozoyensis (strain ATCC 20868 / MF5171) TaxID=1116229 RepID=S3DEN7_GLAL2|nr:uncharacterized protein GLAREA_03403 [Glarea lozoyensis ATCC 20868]EPE30436.1 hypothetical protein GLAREA_03403 [Glarea lozoyensis ATCC 20868]
MTESSESSERLLTGCLTVEGKECNGTAEGGIQGTAESHQKLLCTTTSAAQMPRRGIETGEIQTEPTDAIVSCVPTTLFSNSLHTRDSGDKDEVQQSQGRICIRIKQIDGIVATQESSDQREPAVRPSDVSTGEGKSYRPWNNTTKGANKKGFDRSLRKKMHTL